MAAPSVGRRSCAGQREAAALISQSRRKVVWACQKGCCTTAFFLCRRPAGNRYIFLKWQILSSKSQQSNCQKNSS